MSNLVCIWHSLKKLVFFTIWLIFASIYRSHCTFWYYIQVPLYYFSFIYYTFKKKFLISTKYVVLKQTPNTINSLNFLLKINKKSLKSFTLNGVFFFFYLSLSLILTSAWTSMNSSNEPNKSTRESIYCTFIVVKVADLKTCNRQKILLKDLLKVPAIQIPDLTSSNMQATRLQHLLRSIFIWDFGWKA